MSCITGASPTWGSAPAFQSNENSPAGANTEAAWDSFPLLLIDSLGFTCEQAKQYMIDNFNAVIQDGAVFPELTADMFSVDAGSGTINVDGENVGTWFKTPTEFSTTLGPLVSGVDFFSAIQVFKMGGPCVMTIPIVQLLSYDVNAWFNCATQGRCSIQQVYQPPRLLTLTNHTFQFPSNYGRLE